MTSEQLRAYRRALMARADYDGIQLCNQALCPNTRANVRNALIGTLNAREDLRERVLRGEK